MKRLIPFAKVIVSLGLLLLLFKIIDIKSLKETLMGINPVYLVMGIAGVFTIILLASCRWWICLMPQGIDVSIGKCLNYSLIGFFFNNFAPSTVGGDVAKGIIVGRSSKRKLGTAISIIMDRLIGLVATGILAVLALLVSFNLPIDKRIRLLILLFVLIVMVFFFLLLNKSVSRRLVSFLSSRRLSNIADKISSISSAFSTYLGYPRLIKNALVISFILQVGNIFVCYLLALGIGIKLSFLYFFIFIPLIMAVMSIPISLNGLGLREGAYVVFFSMAGLSKEEALAISIAYYFVVLTVSLIGGLLLLRSGFRRRKEEAK